MSKETINLTDHSEDSRLLSELCVQRLAYVPPGELL